MLIGCQTITFRNVPNPLPLPDVLKAVTKAGFDGVEIASQSLDLLHPDAIKPLLDENDLELMALHLPSKNFFADTEKNVDVDALLKYGQALGVPYIPVSGIGNQGPEYIANAMNEWGRRFAEHDMLLCYHNHGGEMKNNFVWLDGFCKTADPALVGLVLDLGWTHRVGEDPVQALHRFGKRVKYIHLKDQLNGAWCELGLGEINLAGIVDTAAEMGLPWLVSEQDKTESDPTESVRINAACLKGLAAGK